MTTEIDFERTGAEYRRQLEAFMDSFLMKCSPFDEDMNDLIQDAEARMQIHGSSWLEGAMGFCSFTTIEAIHRVQDPNVNPYDDIRLEPSHGTLTSNWFLWDCRPCFEVPYDGARALSHELGDYTRSRFLDIDESRDQLNYLRNNIGERILDCYRFWSVNDFQKERWCYRFSRPGYLREAILCTQGFVLNYIERHPLDCFSDPIIKDQPLNTRLLAKETKMSILAPILGEYLPIIRDRRGWVETELRRYNLLAETI